MTDVQAALSVISNAETESFNALVSLAKLDPSAAFVGADLSNMVFDGEVLEGYDFTDADFRGSTFEGTIISKSNLKGAKFDKHVSINLESDITISPSDKDFGAIAELIYEYKSAALARDREYCLKALIQRFYDRPGVVAFVRRSSANDKAYSVPKSLKKYLASRDAEFDSYTFMLQIIRGENSSRHIEKAFVEAWNLSGADQERLKFLKSYALDRTDLHEIAIDLCTDYELNEFMELLTNHLRSKAFSQSRSDISYTLMSLARNSRISEHVDSLLDRLIEDNEFKVEMEPSSIWQLSTVMRASRSGDVGQVRQAMQLVLNSATRIHTSIPNIVPPVMVRRAGLQHDVWNWILTRYEPEADDRRYWLFDLYEWTRIPFEYFQIAEHFRDALASARKYASSAQGVELEVEDRLAGREFSDILEVIKNRLFAEDDAD